MGLTEEQKNLAMVITGKVSGLISVVSSLLIIRDIYKTWKRKGRSVQLPSTTLLVLSMSIGDVGSSFFTFFLGSWMAPRDEGFPLSAGTDATCDAQAFLYAFFFGSSNMTNGIMALVYWLVICKEKPEKDLQTWQWRGLMYGCPWLWGILYGAVMRNTWSPAEVPLVWYCYGMFAEPGSKGAIISMWVVLSFFVGMSLMILLSMVALVLYINNQEKGMDQFLTSQVGPASSADASRRRSSAETMSEQTVQNRIQVAWQGFFYTAAFLAISILMLLNGCLFNLGARGDYEKMNLPMGYYVFWAAFVPLQGFFNFCIYFRLSFRKYIEENTEGLRSTTIAQYAGDLWALYRTSR